MVRHIERVERANSIMGVHSFFMARKVFLVRKNRRVVRSNHDRASAACPWALYGGPDSRGGSLRTVERTSYRMLANGSTRRTVELGGNEANDIPHDVSNADVRRRADDQIEVKKAGEFLGGVGGHFVGHYLNFGWADQAQQLPKFPMVCAGLARSPR